MNEREKQFIVEAFQFLDKPGLLLKVAQMVGRPVEAALAMLPAKSQAALHKASTEAMRRGLLVVTRTVPSGELKTADDFAASESGSRARGRWHALASFGTGAVGGFFGLLALPVELPITTAIMLRSIAAIAREFGMDLNDPQVQLECLYILSLGATDASEKTYRSVYWTSRSAFAQMSREAARFIGQKTAQEITRELETHSATVLTKLLATLASRFEVVVSEKFLAESVPVIGALGGGAINAAFTNYFSEAARYHFGLRALENRYGREKVEELYHLQLGKS